MSDQTRQLIAALRARLHSVIRRTTLADLAYGTLVTLSVFAVLWLSASALEAGFWLETTVRSILFWSLSITLFGLAFYFLVVPCLRLVGILPSLSEESIANRIGHHFPEVSDRLVNLLHLADGKSSQAPNPFVDSAVRMLNDQVKNVPFEQVEDFSRARHISRYASLPILGLLGFGLFAPTMFWDASMRLASPSVTFERPAPFMFNILPGSIEVVKGANVELRFSTSGTSLPTLVALDVNNEDEEHIESLELTPDSSGTFVHTLVNVRSSLRYRVAAPPVTSAWYEVTVVERPIVRGLQASLTFPSYTGIPPQRLEPNVGDVTALPGTQVSLEIGLGGQNVETAVLRFDDGRVDTLAMEMGIAKGTFHHLHNGTYSVILTNDQNLENLDPITYNLALVADAHPSIALLEPEPLAELNETRHTQLRMRLTDDFGFNRLRLFYRLAESRFGLTSETFEPLDLPLSNRRLLDQEVVKDWLLSQETRLDPIPGDVIEYYVQVWDNDAISGFKSARSGIQRLRLPSLLEQYDALDEQQDTVEDTIEEIVEEAESVREQFEELRDELRQNPESDWEDERQIEQLQERQRELEQRAEELSNQVEELTRQMQDNNLVSEETMQLNQELQKVVEEINSPELQEALQQLQQAMENLDMQQMQQAIQNFEFNETQYQQRLERALELFKQIRVQQELEEAARRAEELAKQQERLAEQTEQLQQEDKETSAEDDAQSDENEGERQNEENNKNEGENKQQNEQSGENAQESEQSGQEQNEQSNAQNAEQNQQEGEQNDSQNSEQQSSEPSDQEQLAKEQERAAEEMEQLLEQLEQLQEQMEDVQRAPSEQLEQMREQSEQMPQEMQQNADQLRQNQLNDAQQGQQQMQQQLQQMQSQLSEMQQGMQGQQMQVNMAGLRQALDDILTLSQQQETLRDGVRGMASDSPQLRDFSQQQVELSEDLTVVTDSLQKLANDIPQMSREVQQQAGEALMEMGQATSAMTERLIARASGHQKDAMTHLNELALLLSDLMNQLMNMQSSSGQGSGMSLQQMMQQLQQMSQQQQQLNQQIQQMLNDAQGNRLSQDMQGRLNQMAAQQEMMRRQLRQLNRNPELRGKALGDLQRIANQMEETINELQNRQVNRRTMDRQRQILQRLLNATQSLNERGRERRREGQTGDQFNRESPGALTPSEEADQLRRALIKALESGYAPDYEELIKRYFELLQQQSQETGSDQ